MIVVCPAAPADLLAAARLLAAAFEHDPVTAAVVAGSPDDRRARMCHLFVGLLRPAVAAGTVDLARHAGRPDLLGVALWDAPDTRTSVLELARQLPAFARVDGPAGLLRALTVKLAVERYRPRRAHWYLQEIGVAAHARGSGVGSALLAARLAVADARDVPAYLESSTERNRRLYRRHGFVDVAPMARVPSVPVSMWRASVSERAAATQRVAGPVPGPRSAAA